MTRKDYQLIADALKRNKPPRGGLCAIQYNLTVGYLADALQTENPRFDRGRFLEACGVED